MSIDPGIVIVILAVLIFYLRLIILQRERLKRLSQAPGPVGKKRRKGGDQQPRYSIVSQSRRDWTIAGVGVLAILAGVLLYSGINPLPAARSYWCVPTALGIVAFSWAFKL